MGDFNTHMIPQTRVAVSCRRLKVRAHNQTGILILSGKSRALMHFICSVITVVVRSNVIRKCIRNEISAYTRTTTVGNGRRLQFTYLELKVRSLY
jgi:hypothetical protein